jgi:hypothetical protein
MKKAILYFVTTLNLLFLAAPLSVAAMSPAHMRWSCLMWNGNRILTGSIKSLMVSFTAGFTIIQPKLR